MYEVSQYTSTESQAQITQRRRSRDYCVQTYFTYSKSIDRSSVGGLVLCAYDEGLYSVPLTLKSLDEDGSTKLSEGSRLFWPQILLGHVLGVMTCDSVCMKLVLSLHP